MKKHFFQPPFLSCLGQTKMEKTCYNTVRSENQSRTAQAHLSPAASLPFALPLPLPLPLPFPHNTKHLPSPLLPLPLPPSLHSPTNEMFIFTFPSPHLQFPLALPCPVLSSLPFPLPSPPPPPFPTPPPGPAAPNQRKNPSAQARQSFRHEQLESAVSGVDRGQGTKGHVIVCVCVCDGGVFFFFLSVR